MIVIYHDNCADGFAAAWVLHKLYADASFIPAQYGDTPPNVTGEDVVIADFSYPRKTLEAIKNQARSLVVLDHHGMAQTDLRGLDYCHFDMNKSGGRLAWDFFFPNQPVPQIINYTEDRDLWRWKLPKSKEISAYLATLPKNFIEWDEANTKIETLGIEAVAELGKIALRVVDQYVATQASRARRVVIGGYSVPCINTSFAISEIVSKLAKNEPFAAGWFQRDDGKFVYSLRSYGNKSLDLGVIAHSYGGGGHSTAAGFVSDTILPQE